MFALQRGVAIASCMGQYVALAELVHSLLAIVSECIVMACSARSLAACAFLAAEVNSHAWLVIIRSYRLAIEIALNTGVVTRAVCCDRNSLRSAVRHIGVLFKSSNWLKFLSTILNST